MVTTILGEPNCGKTTCIQSAAHLSSNPNRIYAANATLQFMMQDKAAFTQWNGIDDNEKCSKEQVFVVSGNSVYSQG